MALDYDNITYHQQLNGITKLEMDEYYDDAEVANLYLWLDRIPISRPKKDIAKDFQDGVLVAEVLRYYIPSCVDLHNYTPAHQTNQQRSNWNLLNEKVLKRYLDLDLSHEIIHALTKRNPKPRVIEKVLMLIRMQLDKYLERKGRTRHEIDLSLALEKQVKDNSKALVRTSKSTGRRSPEKVASPRKSKRSEIPHGHPDRSTYFNDVKPPVYESKLLVVPSSENVPRSLLEEKEMENIARTETIKILSAKVQSLEHLLHLKDMRLRDLTYQLHDTSGMYRVTTKSYR